MRQQEVHITLLCDIKTMPGRTAQRLRGGRVKRLMANWALVVHSLPLPPDLRKAGLDAN